MEQSCEIISKCDQWFQSRRILKNFSEVYTMQKTSPPTAAMFSTDQNFANNLLKGSHKEQSCEFIPNSGQRFQRRRFLNYKKPPPGGHVFRRIGMSRTIFEMGYPRNNPVKLFQNRTSGFREDFSRIP